MAGNAAWPLTQGSKGWEPDSGRAAFILVVVLSAAASGADYPPAVATWMEKHPEAQVVGWRRYDLYRGDSLWRIKNDVEYVTVDDSGVEVDPSPVIDEDRLYRHSVVGGMTDYLANWLVLNPNKEVMVSIFPRTMRPRNFQRATDERSFMAQRQSLHDFCADAVRPLVDLLVEIGVAPLYVAQTTPFVLVRLTPMQVYAIKSNEAIDVIDVFHEPATQFNGDIFTSTTA